MRRLTLAGVVLLAACGSAGEVTTTVAPAPIVTAPATTTTTPTAPAVPREDLVQIIAIDEIFTTERRVEICLMMLEMFAAGLSKDLIVQLGIDSFREGFPTLNKAGEGVLRSILEGCLP